MLVTFESIKDDIVDFIALSVPLNSPNCTRIWVCLRSFNRPITYVTIQMVFCFLEDPRLVKTVVPTVQSSQIEAQAHKQVQLFVS